MADWQLWAELLVLGCAVGFLAGLLGIGGGMLLVPFMTFLLGQRGFPPELLVKVAIATSLATICFTSLASVRAHHRRGAVDWSIVKPLAPGIVIGTLLGAQLASLMPGATLAIVFAAFVAFSALQMFLDRKPKPTRTLPAWPGMLGAGSGIGVLSALVGAGGGFISVPFMTWCNVPIHRAVGTSAALGFPIAVSGTIGYIIAGWDLEGLPPGAVGFLYVPALLLIATTSVLLAPVGAAAAHRMNVRHLKRVFAGLLFVLAGYMLYKGLTTP
jgi:uncharacterized protein